MPIDGHVARNAGQGSKQGRRTLDRQNSVLCNVGIDVARIKANGQGVLFHKVLSNVMVQGGVLLGVALNDDVVVGSGFDHNFGWSEGVNIDIDVESVLTNGRPNFTCVVHCCSR